MAVIFISSSCLRYRNRKRIRLKQCRTIRLARKQEPYLTLSSICKLLPLLNAGTLIAYIMHSQLFRVATFKDWPHAGQPLRLSRMGFYYKGQGKTLTCYQCGSEFEDWDEVDELIEIHRVRSPGCSSCESSRNDVQNLSAKDVTDFLRAVPDADIVNTSANVARSAAAVGKRDVVDTVSAAPDFDRLRLERIRLETFQEWPARAARVVDPRDLAEAGLFYTGQQDRVQCAFCRGFLRNWIRGDRPIDEHRKHFPDCPFVRGLDVGNVRYVETSDNLRDSRSPAQYTTTSSSATHERPAASAGVVNLTETDQIPADRSSRKNQAKHPEFVDVVNRVQSYRGKRVGNGQTVKGLADAGFFHVGPQDNVRCFQCDGGLKNWQPTDDPWTEHARWFPRCPFLLANKDQQFIRDAQIVRNEAPNHSFQHTANPRGRYHVEPREIKARMDSASVQAVINMGYRRELVRQAIERRLTTTGDDFPNTQSLLEAVFEIEDDPSLQQDSSQTDLSNSSSVSTLRNTASFQSTASSFSAANSTSASEHRSRSNIVNDQPQILDADAQAVVDENRRLREARTCSVCMDKEVNTVFLPCGHLVCCNECSQSLTNCAVCRALIRGTVKIFLS